MDFHLHGWWAPLTPTLFEVQLYMFVIVQYHLLKEIELHICRKSIDNVCRDIFMESIFYSIDLYVCSFLCVFFFFFSPVPYCIDHCGFMLSLEIWWYKFTFFVAPLQICFGYSTSLLLHTFRNQLISFYKKSTTEILIRMIKSIR